MKTKTKAKAKTTRTTKALQAKIDRYSELVAHVSQFKREIESLKSEIKGLGAGSYPGTKWTVTVSDRESTRLDITGMRRDFTESCLAPYEIKVPQQVLTTKANPSKGIIPIN